MRMLSLAMIALWCMALPAAHAATKKVHRSHRAVVEAPVQPRLNPFGNAAAEGNNANSMSGSNSPADNAIGRTSGSGFH